MCRHLDLMIEVFGETHGCRMFRKVAPWYARRFGPANEFNKRVVHLSTRAEFLEISTTTAAGASNSSMQRRVEAPLPPRASGRLFHAAPPAPRRPHPRPQRPRRGLVRMPVPTRCVFG